MDSVEFAVLHVPKNVFDQVRAPNRNPIHLTEVDALRKPRYARVGSAPNRRPAAGRRWPWPRTLMPAAKSRSFPSMAAPSPLEANGKDHDSYRSGARHMQNRCRNGPARIQNQYDPAQQPIVQL